MNKTTRNIIIGTGLAVAGASAAMGLSYLVTKRMVSVAMDRRFPGCPKKNMERISGTSYPKNVMDMVEQGEEALRASDCKTVEVKSRDGLRLVGHLYVGPNPKRIIIAMHGWRSTWANNFGVIADFWFQNDCAVLFAEQRGQGKSEGEYITFGLLERYDCLAWVDYVNQALGGSLPVYLCGLSMGATTVMMAGGLALQENVRGIISDCGFTSTDAIWEHVAEHNIKVPYSRYTAALAEHFSRRNINMGTREYSTVDALRRCKVPVLFIHGTDDRFVPVDMTFQNYKACASPKRLLVVPGADHCLSYIVDRPQYEETVKNFWRDFD